MCIDIKINKDLKPFFETLKYMYENDISTCFDIPDKSSDYLIECYEENCNYILHTDIMTISCRCVVNIDDEDSDKGSWFKTWDFEEITSKYGKNRPNIGKEKCKIEISKLCLKLELLDPLNEKLWK